MPGTRTLSLIVIGAAVALLVGGGSVAALGTESAGLAAATRNTGRWSIALFTWVWLSWCWRKQAPEVGSYAAFTAAHLVHLGFITLYVQVWPAWGRLAGGMLGYALLVLAPFARAYLSPRIFNWFARVYFPYLWLVFFITYLTRARGSVPGATTEPTVAWLMLGFIACALLLGAVGLFRTRQLRV